MGDKMNDPGTTGEQLELDWTASIPEIKPGAVSSIGSDKRGLDIVSGDANWLLRVLGRVRLLFPPCTTEFPRQERRTLFPLRETFAPTVNNVDSIKLCKPTVEAPHRRAPLTRHRSFPRCWGRNTRFLPFLEIEDTKILNRRNSNLDLAIDTSRTKIL